MDGVTRGQSLFRHSHVRPFCCLCTNCHETQRHSAGHMIVTTPVVIQTQSLRCILEVLTGDRMIGGGVCGGGGGGGGVVVVGRGALEGKGPQSRPHKRVDRRLEEVATAVGVG